MLNYFNKYTTGIFTQLMELIFLQFGLEPLSTQKKLISHTSANGGVRLFVLFCFVLYKHMLEIYVFCICWPIE